MLVIEKGKCTVQCDGPRARKVEGVTYKDYPVYIGPESLYIGKYMAAYIVPYGKPRHFGEIKLTTGYIENNTFNGNYVLCEY